MLTSAEAKSQREQDMQSARRRSPHVTHTCLCHRPPVATQKAWSVVTPYRLSSWRVETWSLRRLRADSVVAVAVLTEEDQRSAGAGQVQACSSDGQPSACFRDRSAISAKKLTANWRRRAAEQAGGRGLATANTA
nr:hypothetical protein Iba_chr05dCG14000 [Ipomoea batatas]